MTGGKESPPLLPPRFKPFKFFKLFKPFKPFKPFELFVGPFIQRFSTSRVGLFEELS